MTRALHDWLAGILDTDRIVVEDAQGEHTGRDILVAAQGLGLDSGFAAHRGAAHVLAHCLERWSVDGVVYSSPPGGGDDDVPMMLLETVRDDFEDAALSVYSSGTSARPLAVIHGPDAVRFNLETIARSLPPPGRMVGLSPLSHIYGLVGQLLYAVSAGGVYVQAQGDTWLEKVDFALRCAADGVQLVPAQLSAMLDLVDDRRRAPAWVASAGARVPVKLWQRWRDIMPQARRYTQYGCTEAGPRIACWEDDGGVLVPGLVGQPLPGVEVTIEQGRVVANTPGAYLGGVEADEDRSRAWRHHGPVPTGDAGHVDEAGRLVIDGRADGVINTGGVRVSPSAVEDALLAVPGIDDVVVGAAPSERLGEVVKAAIQSGQEPDDLMRAVRDHIGGAMRPRAFCFWTELPRLPSGKIDRARALKGPEPS